MELITKEVSEEIIRRQKEIGEAFNQASAKTAFDITAKAKNTKLRYEKELRNFAFFLDECGFHNQGMTAPEEWKYITFGIVDGYKRYLLQKGYSINSVNQTLYIIRRYCREATRAGFIPVEEMGKIQLIEGVKSSEAPHIDEERASNNIPTRASTKKIKAKEITPDQVDALKHQQPDTLRGKRDALLFAILLDMGLRESEIITLTWDSINPETRVMTWHRKKTNNDGVELVSRDILQALEDYSKAMEERGEELSGGLWAKINKGDRISGRGLTTDAVKLIVRNAGDRVGVDHLSPHDLRHSMATRAYLADIPVISIQRRLGHSTASTTERYIDTEKLKRYTDFDKDF